MRWRLVVLRWSALYAGEKSLSTQALTGPATALLGSVADAVVRRAHCPVLLVHRGNAAPVGLPGAMTEPNQAAQEGAATTG
jgi:hypothetical protein